MTNSDETSQTPDFQTFEKGRRIVNRKNPSVSISAGKSIRMNDSLYERLGEPDYVRLYIDEGKKLIGFEASEQSDENAYSVNNKSISGQSILGTIGLNDDTSAVVEAQMNEQMPYIDVSRLTDSDQ